MPDRMRWIYRDPSGNTQGPFSGLEMHDWYKAGFFSPELLVKKQEELDYEPLAQLIRRIGNSREPFLVPQIGIPHGPATAQPGNAWAGAANPTTTPGAQPPFANSFPSFGTTLTAEQQNALERRKQEEQYLMARQKEHLAAQQSALARQVQIGGILPNLNHHSSAHSLHSQPSYGSITSPGGYQQSPSQGPVPGLSSVPGLIDNAFRAGPGSVPGLGPIGAGSDMMGNLGQEEVPGLMERLNLGRTGQPAFGAAPPNFVQQQSESSTHAQQVAAMLNDRARLQREQADHDNMQRFAPNEQQNAQTFADRFQQFNDLRLQTNLDQGSKAAPPPEGIIGKPSASTAQRQEAASEITSPDTDERQYLGQELRQEVPSYRQEPLSLTEQVQKAQSAKHSPQPQSAWNKVEPAIFPFPPAPSQSPLPAPAAQRKPIIAESLATEARSGAATPAAETPSASIAPWAKEPTEASRGPSLREIQEAEAKKAAEREALASAARREAFEKELLAQTNTPVIQPGLPTSSNWASGASPVTPGGAAASVWGAKAAVGKVATPSATSSKKTLQQIQKEEEARKQRVVAQAAAAASAFGVAAPVAPAGKRYADLASKTGPAVPSVPGLNSAWTTVGASGKTKNPAGTTPAPPAAVRSTSTTIVPSVVKKPTMSRSTTLGGQSGKVNAEEEFRKWAVNELRHDLNKGINGTSPELTHLITVH
jgi:PERQ amino acid-rich with GYF domain-containing protein